jgi:hypothetical protein
MQLTLKLQLIRAKSKNQVFNQLSAAQQAQLVGQLIGHGDKAVSKIMC